MSAVRVNITLPEDVIEILQKKTKSGEKSSFIAEAVRSYAKNQSRETLIKKLIQDYSSYELTSEDQDWLDADLGGQDDGR